MKGRPELMKLWPVSMCTPLNSVSMQVPNLLMTSTTYDVKEGDGMWRSPEDRVIKTKTKEIILVFACCMLDKGLFFVSDSQLIHAQGRYRVREGEASECYELV